LPRHILTQGTAIRSLMRNLGGSVGISVLVAVLAENTQTVHAQLVEGLRPDNPIIHSPLFGFPYSLTAPSGVAALNAMVTRQASMVAYLDDFWLLMVLCIVAIPLLLLLRDASPVRTAAPAPIAAAAAADD
jgi:DHA2 family multidrug resistance protein